MGLSSPHLCQGRLRFKDEIRALVGLRQLECFAGKHDRRLMIATGAVASGEAQSRIDRFRIAADDHFQNALAFVLIPAQ